MVHGPLTAAKLFALAPTPVRHFSFQAKAPLFAGQAIRLTASVEGALEAIRCDGAVAMSAVATPA